MTNDEPATVAEAPERAVRRLAAIRALGTVNMMSRTAVAAEAARCGFWELAAWCDEVGAEPTGRRGRLWMDALHRSEQYRVDDEGGSVIWTERKPPKPPRIG